MYPVQYFKSVLNVYFSRGNPILVQEKKKSFFFFFFRYSSLLPFWQVNIHPLELFSRGAFHGGSWRSPYARYPAVGRTATALGLLAPFRFSAALLES